ncbi:MAG: Gfo/Idh/MocA family oxidoreductase [Chitinophagaceae bacterium]|nr:Gfo/Idh/MocA family oxidoreductase [Chitinophagaceae bacterium]
MTPISTGIASYGMSGKLFHAPFIDVHPGFELSGIVERNRTDSRARYPDSKLFRSFEELLADDHIELVIVNTPTLTHFDYTKAALLAGKKVIVEKPFTVELKEAEELAELADKKGLFLCVYQNRRYDGDYLSVKNVVEKKLLGDLREVEIRYDRYRPHAAGKPHKEGELPGAGIIYDLGPHLIDQALQLFGWPKAVFADIWRMRPDVQATDYFEILFYYSDFRVRLKATCIAREPFPAYSLHGMKGSFFQERSDQQEQKLLAEVRPSFENWCGELTQPDGLLHTEIDGQVTRQQTISKPGNYMYYFDDVYKALTGQAPNPVPVADGVKTIRIIDAAWRSSKEGRGVEV